MVGNDISIYQDMFMDNKIVKTMYIEIQGKYVFISSIRHDHEVKHYRCIERVLSAKTENDIPDSCAGVYVVTTIRGDKYVGCSKNLHNRLHCHFTCNRAKRRKIKDPISNVMVYITDNLKYAKILEREFIVHLKPELNVLVPFKEGWKRR